MRMPPNEGSRFRRIIPRTDARLQWRAACACRRIAKNCRYPQKLEHLPLPLQWRAACACRRMPPRARATGVANIEASMEGGMRMPPNRSSSLHRQAQPCRQPASMEGGMRMPPNPRPGRLRVPLRSRAACVAEWDWHERPGRAWRFNGGRHAHAAEFRELHTSRRPEPYPCFNGGRHAHAAELAGVHADATRSMGGVLQWRAACACRRMAPSDPGV